MAALVSWDVPTGPASHLRGFPFLTQSKPLIWWWGNPGQGRARNDRGSPRSQQHLVSARLKMWTLKGTWFLLWNDQAYLPNIMPGSESRGWNPPAMPLAQISNNGMLPFTSEQSRRERAWAEITFCALLQISPFCFLGRGWAESTHKNVLQPNWDPGVYLISRLGKMKTLITWGKAWKMSQLIGPPGSQ